MKTSAQCSCNYIQEQGLALRGAEVLHEDAVRPVSQCGIPINIKSTLEPEKPGTLIVKNADSYENRLEISSITGKKGYSCWSHRARKTK